MKKSIKIIIVAVVTSVVLFFAARYFFSGVNESDPRFQQLLQEVSKNDPSVVARSSVNIALMPMYGGFEKTAEQKKGDEEFINGLLKTYGTKEDASSAVVVFAKQFFEKGDLDMAMKRFNDAWLVDDKNPDVYVGFGDILKKRGHDKEATDMYKKAEEVKSK